MIVLFLFAFLSGLVTILAPCIWPLLPIILSSSVAGKGHRRPLGITLGIMLSFAIFTLSISTLVSAFHFDPNILRVLAVIVIGGLGLAMVVPKFNSLLELLISRMSSKFSQAGKTQGNGFVPGLATGLSLGIVWAPCAGPILATIAALSAMREISLSLVLVTLFYVAGVGIPLFAFAYGGRSLISRTRFLSSKTGRIQQAFGIVMILTAVAILTNFDKSLQVKLLDLFPQYTNALTALESNDEVKQQLDILKGSSAKQSPVSQTNGLFNVNPSVPAPEFAGVTKWLNLPDGASSLSLSDLRGKVVLIDFWTYTCINCIRTLPHVTSWYDKYKDQGFTVIGVHTPEFEFEKTTANVADAIQRFSIHYPVPQDNDYGTWNAYTNQYWPAEYLIDSKGQIRRVHFGEGEYEEMEQAIQLLLKEAGKNVTSSTVEMPDETPQSRISPETYLGESRSEYFYLTGKVPGGEREFKSESLIPLNSYSLGGTWNIEDENAVAVKNSELIYHFTAQKVFLVMGADRSAEVMVYLDGKPVTVGAAGADVNDGKVSVKEFRLYSLIQLKQQGDHILRLVFPPGVEAFAFTFG